MAEVGQRAEADFHGAFTANSRQGPEAESRLAYDQVERTVGEAQAGSTQQGKHESVGSEPVYNYRLAGYSARNEHYHAAESTGLAELRTLTVQGPTL